MKLLSLFAGLLLLCNSASAGLGITPLTYSGYHNYWESRDEVNHVSFFSDFTPMFVMTPWPGKLTLEGKGAGAQLEYGVKVSLKAREGGINTFLSVSLAVLLHEVQSTYRDVQNRAFNEHREFVYYALPLSITEIMNKNHHKVAFYWQGGLSLEYLNRASDDYYGSLTANYDHLCVAPFGSAGISFNRRVRRGFFRRGMEKDMIGPYFTFGVTHMTTPNTIAISNYSVGLRLTAIII